jgi:hypothetical protein
VNKHVKGHEREKSLTKDAYKSAHYSDLYQLMSFSHQINDICRMKPKSILEIGIGNGFMSTFLKSQGFEVLTADINPNLGADIVCDILDLPKFCEGSKFDLVVCCEVLEHMPFEKFDDAISVIASLSNRAYITLPNYNKFFGFSGFFDFPRLRKPFNFGIFLPVRRKITEQHFWELDLNNDTSKSNITSILNRKFSKITSSTYKLNRYHHLFVCENF